MIGIVNRSGKKYGKGMQRYDLFVNEKKMFSFTHKFEDGLAECLRRGADQWDMMQKENKVTGLMGMLCPVCQEIRCDDDCENRGKRRNHEVS